MNQSSSGKTLPRRAMLPDTGLLAGDFERSKESFRASFCWSSVSLETLISHQQQFLRPPEFDYLLRSLHDNRRRSYLLGRYCAKEALCQYLDNENRTCCAIVPGVFQQPVIRGTDCGNLQVSISHCNNAGIAVAFDEAHPIAIDIEAVSPDRRETIQSQLTEDEKMIAANSSGTLDENLACIWTAKEALSKVLKTGMMTPFTLFEIEKTPGSSQGLNGVFKSFAQYRFLSFTTGSFAVGLVFPKQSQLSGSLLRLTDEVRHAFNGLAAA